MRASRAVDRIGVVIHGPEIIDSGFALRCLDYLERFGKVTAVLGGTMGRVAVIDAGLEKRIDISRRMAPSSSVLELQAMGDIVVLLNQAKSRETGLAFGNAVASKVEPIKPLIQIDFGGKFVAQLSGPYSKLAGSIAGDLGLELITPVQFPSSIKRNGKIVRRKLVGACPGENISINGIVVAKATDSTVEIFAQDGIISKIKGALLKAHGIEKLPPLDLEHAILRSGDIRRTEKAPRIIACSGEKIALIDHAAEGAFEAAIGAAVVITVGDDTTAIAGDILTRFGIPVIGIVDGDLDNLSHKTAMPNGSVIVCVSPGCDDIVGRRVKEKLFRGEEVIHVNGRSIEELATQVEEMAGDDLIRAILR
jgi:hypothetical protein